MREWLLGFDARELWLDVGSQWDASRRGLYLLREDARKPLATDATVWPSLFGEGLPESERERLGLRDASRPEWTGPNAPLWDDLERMRSCLASLGAVRNQPHALCGYTESEAPGLRAQWSGHLNEHHLLGDLGRALEFRDASDERVPEHAPFFVFGLWLIETRMGTRSQGLS
ncbi:hypothetical protein JQX13_37765 [Archangium violaceum]|uniref:hypothetical protein n=1 Tax=Archangium violaceum TaxID=83451 RepID=UPI00193BEBCE|nr:hypothetical protein [Archangium violaceum]QRK05845.1 hypothetical protein JQX13_37765 [Archangium violaceum]